MSHNIETSKLIILKTLHDKSIKHKINDCPSGCSMIDIWVEDRFYVIQLEPDSIGMSLVDGMDLSTIPDERFYDLEKFLEKFNTVIAQKEISN